MQEFCPLCSRNGVKAMVKAFQLNLQEAVYMCSSKECTWPTGYQDLVFIDRPVGKDWSSTWDDAVNKNLKIEHDPLLELSAYTPPQTPGTEIKDVVGCSLTQTIVPDKLFNSVSNILDNTVNNSLDTIPYEVFVDKDSHNVSLVVKPKLAISKSVNYKLEKLPSTNCTVKSNETKKLHATNNVQVTNGTTSLNYNASPNKNSKFNLSPVKPAKEKLIQSSRQVAKRKKKKIIYQKFDFDHFFKEKSTNVEVSNVKEIETKSSIKEVNKNECFSNLNNIKSMNATNECVNANVTELDKMSINNTCSSQSDIDTLLAITNSSKDSGIDQDIIIDSDLDAHLDDLLAGFSDDHIVNNEYKSNMDDAEDYKWINSLFE